MKNYNIVFCETNSTLLTNAIGFFNEDLEMNLIPCESAKDVVEIKEEVIHGLIIDENFPGVRDIITSFQEKGTRVVLTARLTETSEQFGFDYPYDMLIYKPYSLLEIRMRLIKAFVQQSMVIKLNTTKNIDERLSNIFIRAGIPPHIKGYQFLREAVKLSIVEPDLINSITQKLYPSIAKLYDTTPSKVERAIRHAIEVAWNRGKIENINAIFGIKIYNKGDKPTNGELIALVADKIMIETM